MKKRLILFATFFVLTAKVTTQTETQPGTFWHPNPRNYNVNQAIEVESLVPMFFTGGYHFAVGYRYKNSG